MKYKNMLLIIILLLLITGCGNSNQEESSKNKEIKTLSEYITKHDSEHMGCGGEGCGDMNFVSKDFKCDIINDKEIIYMNSDFFVTNDNKIYTMLFDKDKKYSNNQQCIEAKLDYNVDYANKVYNNYLVIQSGKEYYQFYDNGAGGYTYQKIDNLDPSRVLLKEGYSILGYANKGMYALKDGEIYLIKVKDNKIISKDLYLSKDEYGYIKYARFDEFLYRYKKSYLNIESTITKLITDKGIYVLKENITDECSKYEDVKCELKLQLSDIYSKYKDDIKYLGLEYTILKDNNVISTNIFYADLDK